MNKPEPPPEAELIERKRNALRPKPSIRASAAAAGMSEGRWRQIAKGYQSVTRDVVAPVVAPAETIARMLTALGPVTDDEIALLRRARPDVVDVLLDRGAESRKHQRPLQLGELTDEDLINEVLRRMKGQHHAQAPESWSQAGGSQQPQSPPIGDEADEARVAAWLAGGNGPATETQTDSPLSAGDDTTTGSNDAAERGA